MTFFRQKRNSFAYWLYFKTLHDLSCSCLQGVGSRSKFPVLKVYRPHDWQHSTFDCGYLPESSKSLQVRLSFITLICLDKTYPLYIGQFCELKCTILIVWHNTHVKYKDQSVFSSNFLLSTSILMWYFLYFVMLRNIHWLILVYIY